MGLLSKFMNALIGEPPVSKTATQPGPSLRGKTFPIPRNSRRRNASPLYNHVKRNSLRNHPNHHSWRDRHTARKHKPQLAILLSQRIVRERNLMPIHNRLRSLCRNQCSLPSRSNGREISSAKSKSMS